MDKSDHKLETAAGCAKNTDGSKISYTTTEISLNNKKNLEEIDCSMVYNADDWIDYEYYDVDESTDGPSQALTPELPPIAGTEKKPQKKNIPYSEIHTSETPKCKKRKLPSFDELLEILDYNILYLNFAKLLQFLESNHNDMCFPFTLQEYGEFFKMIVRNISLLKSKSLDAHYRDICDKIAEAANLEKTGFLLTYVYECRQGFQNVVLVIKKVYIMHKPEVETSSPSSCSVMQSSQISSDMDTNNTVSRAPSFATVSRGFKIHCLRTALAFVKNNVTKTKEFPELSTEQANFMQLLLDSIAAFVTFDSSMATKELYRELWNAIKTRHLQYDFRVKCVETFDGKKNLVYEKIPKTKIKPVEMVNNLKQPARNSYQIMKPNTGVPKPDAIRPEAPKPEALKPLPPKPVVPTPQISKPDTPEPVFLKPVAPTSQISKPDTPEPVFLKPVAPTSQISKPDTPEPVFLKPVAPTSQISKPDTPEPVFLKPEIPKQGNQIMTKKMRKKEKKLMNELFFIRQLPSQFIFDTLHSIVAFLSDPLRTEMVFVPKSQPEQDFYRRCIDWCRCCDGAKFGSEFRGLQLKILSLLSHINCRITKAKANKISEETGIKEVKYIKPSRVCRPVHVPNYPQSKPKTKKVNLQNVLNMAATTDNIKLSSLVNLNQSLRHKKKNKRAKKAKIKYHNPRGKSTGTSSSQSMSCTDDSSSESSSGRGSSCDQSKAPPKPEDLTKKIAEEIERNLQARAADAERLFGRRDAMIHVNRASRKELLIEALSVPVQSDKAMRIMRGMGWSGGALGARGDGITEPIMPALDISRGAGFGHIGNLISDTMSKRSKEPTAGPSFIAEKLNTPSVSENDFIVQKTNQLLLHNPTFDSVMKVIELPESSNSSVDLQKPPISNVQLPILRTSNVERPKSTTSNVERPKSTTSNVERPKSTTSNVERPKPATSNVELPKSTSNVERPLSTTSNVERPLSTSSNDERPLSTTSDIERPLSTTSNVECPIPSKFEVPQRAINKLQLLTRLGVEASAQPFRLEILNSVLELLSGNDTCQTLKYNHSIRKKDAMFVIYAMVALKGKYNDRGIFLPEEREVCNQIQEKYKKQPYVVVRASVSDNFNQIDFRKITIPAPVKQKVSMAITKVSPKKIIITKENLEAYIVSFGIPAVSEKAFLLIKFRVLFLLSALSFTKSSNEEFDLSFNKCLTQKQRLSIVNAVEEINMRIKYGSTPVEGELFKKINSHIKCAYLGAMFNHQYTAVTLNKFYDLKQLDKPDGTKRKWQISINTDNYSSETTLIEDTNENIDETKTSTSEPTDTESDSSDDRLAIDEESINPSDDSSVDEYINNNSTATVPRLPPGEEGVNLSNFLHLYETTNSADITNNTQKNDSVSKNDSHTTDNRNDRNNSGNGNVLIDDNDNQVIDVKRDSNTEVSEVIKTGIENISDTEMVEYDMCVEYAEEMIEMGDNVKDKETNDQTVKSTDIVVAQNDHVDVVNQLEDNNAKIDNDDMDKMIHEVLLNTEDLNNDDVVIADSGSKNDEIEDMIRSKIKNTSENPSYPRSTVKDINEESEHVVMKVIDLNEPIDKELMEVSGVNEDSMEVTNRGESIEVTNTGESMEVTNKGESKEVTNKGESSKDVVIVQMEAENIIKPSDNQTMKGGADVEAKTDCDIVSIEQVDLTQDECDTQTEVLKTTDTEIAAHSTIEEKGPEITNESVSMEVTNKGESMEVTNKGESIEVTNKRKPLEITNKGESMQVTNKRKIIEVTNKGESMEVTNKGESMEVTNKGESMEVTNKGESIEVSNKRKPMEITNKGESMEVTNKCKPMEVTNKGESMQVTNKRKIIEVTNKGESVEVTIKRKTIEVTNKGESMQVTNKRKPMEVTNEGEAMEVTNKGESMKVINEGESLKDVIIAQMEQENCISPSDNQTMKGGADVEAKTDRDIVSIEQVDLTQDECDTQTEVLKTTGTEITAHSTIEEKGSEITNKSVSMEVTNKGESMEVTNKSESSKDVTIAQIEEENSINQTMKGGANVEGETDCATVSIEQVDLTRDECDTQTEVLKTTDTDIAAHSTIKNYGSEIKNVSIVHVDYPAKKLSKGRIREIQTQISRNIMKTDTSQLPRLMCHGFDNGRLTYTCYGKKSYDWLKCKINALNDIKVLDTTVTKMALTFYCFIKFDTEYLFKMIELYNRELSTKDWVVEKSKHNVDHAVFVIKMDKFSIDFIQASGLALFAGVDRVEFSPVWE